MVKLYHNDCDASLILYIVSPGGMCKVLEETIPAWLWYRRVYFTSFIFFLNGTNTLMPSQKLFVLKFKGDF